MGVRDRHAARGVGASALALGSLVGLGRAQRASEPVPRQLPLPEDMTIPLGCDAVAVPADYGPMLLPRLPRVGCVYADQAEWWWIVPSDSDIALDWPAPARYAKGALVPDSPSVPGLIHRPHDSLPYTPPIPLYLTLCRLTGTPPVWSRPLSV